MRTTEGRARSAWIASLAIHGVLVAAVAWWLARYTVPAAVLVTPAPIRLAMFQPPASVAPTVAAEPVQEASPPPVVPEPVQAPPPPQVLAEPAPAAPPVEPPSPKSTPVQPKPAEPLPPKPVPVRPKPAKPIKAAPAKPAASAVEPVRAQPVESAPAAEVPVAIQSPAPAPVVPLPAVQPRPAPDPAVEHGYRARIRQAIDEHKHYPRMARRLGLEGRVVVAFTVEADGRLARVRVVESSGSEVLDEAALEAVRQAAPFPPFPDGVERRQWDFTLPLLFSLDS
ncbi:MAG: energy transducer TonB [Halothiobacillaceae bacterium]